MKEKDFRDYLTDLVLACEEIGEFIRGMDYDNFSKDKKTVNAVIRSLEVIGEATKNLPMEFRLKHADIPWKRMAGMRDKLIHEYFGIDKEMVWHAAQKHIPQILPLLKNLQA